MARLGPTSPGRPRPLRSRFGSHPHSSTSGAHCAGRSDRWNGGPMATRVRSGAILALLTGFGTSLSAEPIVITAGTFTIENFRTFATFSLTASDGTTIVGSWPSFDSTCPGFTCAPGAVVTPDAVFVYDTVPFVFGDPFATA